MKWVYYSVFILLQVSRITEISVIHTIVSQPTLTFLIDRWKDILIRFWNTSQYSSPIANKSIELQFLKLWHIRPQSSSLIMDVTVFLIKRLCNIFYWLADAFFHPFQNQEYFIFFSILVRRRHLILRKNKTKTKTVKNNN